MTTYNQGEVVLVPFGYTDSENVKRRPAAVVSANWYNRSRDDCILVAITSTIHSPLERDEVLIVGAEVKNAGLISDSVIRAGKIFTIEKSKIIKSLGRLTAATQQKVLNCLQEIFFAA
jgi:mRNA interferase MazF